MGIKLGYAPTRRSIFSAPDAVKYRNLTADKLREMGVDFVDIDDINDEGLLYDENDRLKIVEKFRREKVDGLLLAHCNFGTEYECARLAKDLNVPVLLWGPLDERPDENGRRLRDTQCGLFATGKVLRRFRVPFTYLTNCRLSDPVFERGVRDFLAVCNVVKTFRNIRILQMGPRPYDFWSTASREVQHPARTDPASGADSGCEACHRGGPACRRDNGLLPEEHDNQCHGRAAHECRRPCGRDGRSDR